MSIKTALKQNYIVYHAFVLEYFSRSLHILCTHKHTHKLCSVFFLLLLLCCSSFLSSVSLWTSRFVRCRPFRISKIVIFAPFTPGEMKRFSSAVKVVEISKWSAISLVFENDHSILAQPQNRTKKKIMPWYEKNAHTHTHKTIWNDVHEQRSKKSPFLMVPAFV